ncbi:MAG: o-succinylbenzoate synthase [Ignavibacteria bacterium]
MNVIELIYAPYCLNLKKPFSTSKGSITARKGFILNLKASNGLIGVGDAAPFPEFGSETYIQAEDALSSLNLEIKIDLANVESSISENLLEFNNLPCLRHGLEQALLNLISKEKNLSIAELINRETKNEICINGIIDLQSKEESVQSCLELKEKGFTTIKMKIGRDNFEEDYETIDAVRKACGDKIKIRLDVNGKWKLGEAKENLKKLENLNAEYVEQPVSSLEYFIELKKYSNIPIAADETIRSVEDALNFISEKAADVFIIKPMMLGGLIPSLKIIEAADRSGIKTVISSSFESAIGRSMAVLAASAVKNDTAHGINTAAYFEKDLIPDPFPVNNGKIIIK